MLSTYVHVGLEGTIDIWRPYHTLDVFPRLSTSRHTDGTRPQDTF